MLPDVVSVMQIGIHRSLRLPLGLLLFNVIEAKYVEVLMMKHVGHFHLKQAAELSYTDQRAYSLRSLIARNQ